MRLRGRSALYGKTLDLGGAGQNYHGRAGQQCITIPSLPLIIDLAQFQHLAMGQPLDVRGGRLPLAQRGRMNPATFRVEQAAVRQFDTGSGLGLGLIEQVHQAR